MERHFPQWAVLRDFLRFQLPALPQQQAKLAKAQTIEDLRVLARKRTPKGPFDYTDGGAEGEVSLLRAQQAFEDVEFHPAILRNVTEVSTSTTLHGRTYSYPFGIAPTGFTRMMHSAGEIAGARAAEQAGIPFTLSTMGTESPEEIARVTGPHADNWFQLYMWKDRDKSLELMDRAKKAGFTVLFLTVDVPVAGARLRDKRNGMVFPPQLTLKTIFDALPRPAWCIDFLTTKPLSFAAIDTGDKTIPEILDTMFDSSVTLEDMQWIAEQWDGPVYAKGVQTLGDAQLLARAGITGIVLSNHGGRQLDRAPVPFHLLPEVVREVGKDLTIMLDTGIRSGADIVASLALGAQFTLIGRAYLYGLMAGGQAGVTRAIEILGEQIARTMRLIGVTSIEELEPHHLTQLHRYERK